MEWTNGSVSLPFSVERAAQDRYITSFSNSRIITQSALKGTEGITLSVLKHRARLRDHHISL